MSAGPAAAASGVDLSGFDRESRRGHGPAGMSIPRNPMPVTGWATGISAIVVRGRHAAEGVFMTEALGVDAYVGKTAWTRRATRSASVGQVYLNDQTGQPDWITVNTGLFGMKENFAPLAGSSFNGDDLVLPFDKDVVKDSPDIADASHLDADEQQSLYAYYQQYLGAGEAAAPGDEPSRPPRAGTPGTSTARATTRPARTPTTR